MSGRKRQPSRMMSIAQIYEGRMKDMGDQSYFMMGEDPIHKVRVFGVVVNRYDGVSKSDREFTSLTLDDGTDTINMTVWSRPIKEDDKVVYNPIDQVKNVNVGDTVDVLGRVRQYDGEFFISPNSTQKQDDIEWEIHRRTQLVQEALQNKNLLPEERDVFAKTTQEVVSENPSSEGGSQEEDGAADIQNDLLNAMSDDFETNTVGNLATKLQMSEDQIQESLNELMMLGEVFERLPGKFQKINSPIS